MTGAGEEQDGPRHGGDPRGRCPPDPTRMVNQPALQTSTGRIWIVTGGLFAAVSLVPLGLLIFGASGRSRGVAAAVAALVILFYAVLVLARFALPRGARRLRVMAASMLAMAAVALVGVWICALIEVSTA